MISVVPHPRIRPGKITHQDTVSMHSVGQSAFALQNRLTLPAEISFFKSLKTTYFLGRWSYFFGSWSLPFEKWSYYCLENENNFWKEIIPFWKVIILFCRIVCLDFLRGFHPIEDNCNWDRTVCYFHQMTMWLRRPELYHLGLYQNHIISLMSEDQKSSSWWHIFRINLICLWYCGK